MSKTKLVTKKTKKTKKNVVARLPPPPALVRSTRVPRAASWVPAVCGLTDPFCEHARYARYPDANGTRSLSYPLRKMFTITTGANGTAAYLIAPNFWNNWENPSSGGTFPNVTFGNAYAARGVLSATSSVRLVSWGFRINHVTTPLNASGIVMVRGFAVSTGTQMLNVDVSTMNADVIANIPLQDCGDVAFVGKRSNTTSQFYTSPSSILASGAAGITLYNGFGYDLYTIAISGGPASAGALSVEVFENWEITIDDADAAAQLMIKPPPSNSVATQAAAIVSSQAETVFLHGVHAASAFLKKQAIKAIGGVLGGPLTASALALAVD